MYLSYLCCWEKPLLVDTRQPRQDRDQTWSWRKNKSKYRNSVWELQVIDVLLSMQTLWWLKHSNILLFRGNLRFHFLIAQVWCQFKKLLPQFLSKSKQMIWDPHLHYFSFLGKLKDCKSIKCLTKFSPICQLAGWIWDEREGEGEVASSPRAVAAQAIRGAAKEGRLENRNFHLKLVPRGSDLSVLTWHEENWSVRAEKAESIAWLSGSQSAG